MLPLGYATGMRIANSWLILLPALLLIVWLPAAAHAEEKVYKSVGPDGEITFSDTPSRGAKEIEVKPAPTYTPAPLPPLGTGRAAPAAPAAAQAYQSLRIVSPPAEQTIVDTAGNMQIAASLQPGLSEGDRLQFLLDGKPVSTGSSLKVELHNINRGAHTLRAQVITADGKILIQSDPITVFLQRPSLNLPGRPKPSPPPASKSSP